MLPDSDAGSCAQGFAAEHDFEESIEVDDEQIDKAAEVQM